MLHNLREAFHGRFDQFRLNEGDGLQGLLHLHGQLLRREGGRRLERTVLVTEAAADADLQGILAIFRVRGPYHGIEAKRSEGFERCFFGSFFFVISLSAVLLFRGAPFAP
jgi:hypothetical protein